MIEPSPWFLGIGAQKAGTTWLSHNLRHHPGVWDLPVKAFNFFNEPPRPLWIRALEPGSQNRRWRGLMYRRLPGTFVRPDRWQNLPWLLRFLISARTDDGYRALMTPPPGKTGGEVTPAYARLDQEAVSRVRRVLPQARIIFLLRDPISRMWSQMGMHWRKAEHTDVGQAGSPTLFRFLEKQHPYRNSDYLTTLSIWERHYPSEQIHIDFLERIAEAPSAVLTDIFRFIGVDPHDSRGVPAPSTPKNVGRTPPMPDDIGRFLARRYLEPCRAYHRRFDNSYTAAWLDRCERMARP